MRSSARFLVASCAFVGVFLPVAIAARYAQAQTKPKLTYDEVRKLADEFVRKGNVKLVPPTIVIKGDKAEMIRAAAEFPPTTGKVSAYQEPIQNQILVDAYRDHLFSRQENRRFMEPYYDDSEKRIKERIEALNATPPEELLVRSPEDAAWGNNNLLEPLFNGLDKWAKSRKLILLSETKYISPRPIKLFGAGGLIELTPLTTYKIFRALGKTEDDITWDTYPDGETVALLGWYRFRIYDPQKSLVEKLNRSVDDAKDKLHLLKTE